MSSPERCNDLVFVHIPKTGGTSVRKALTASGRWQENLLDYGFGSAETSPTVAATVYGSPSVGLRTVIDPSRNLMISGHFVATKYASQLPDATLVTFLRYPVSQVLSHFRHHVARFGFNAGLAEFCRNPAHRNLQTRYLDSVPLERFAFIGILECLTLDIVTLSDLVGAKLSVLHLNRLEVLPAIPLSQKQIAMIEAYNAEDMALYASAIARRSRSRGAGVE